MIRNPKLSKAVTVTGYRYFATCDTKVDERDNNIERNIKAAGRPY